MIVMVFLLFSCPKKESPTAPANSKGTLSDTPRRKGNDTRVDPPRQPDHQRSLLGGERGLDHVNIAVRDLEAARQTFQDRLGFAAPVASHLKNGIANMNYYFEDATYLETLTYYDAKKAHWVADFLKRHTGAMKLVLNVRDLTQTADFLKRRGIKTQQPITGSITTQKATKTPKEMWHKLLMQSPIPCDCLFFIAYDCQSRDQFLKSLKNPLIRQRYLTHANTAQGIKGVWIAVKNLKKAVEAYKSIGLTTGRSFVEPHLGGQGQEIIAGQGSILLISHSMEQIKEKSAVATFLAHRGEGILSMSIKVANLQTAMNIIKERTKHRFVSEQGFFGERILIPADQAHGVWLELFESSK